jgi:hypothetical protein
MPQALLNWPLRQALAPVYFVWYLTDQEIQKTLVISVIVGMSICLDQESTQLEGWVRDGKRSVRKRVLISSQAVKIL